MHLFQKVQQRWNMSSVLQLAYCTIFLHNSTFHRSSNDEAMWDERYDRLPPSKGYVREKNGSAKLTNLLDKLDGHGLYLLHTFVIW